MTVIEYRFKNIQPVIIKDENIEGKNQIDTIRYIPGSSVRGFAISRMDKSFFDANKKEILSDKVRFLNAYPIINDEISIPSPKNYYANKSDDKVLKSILETEKDNDSKRAGLGDFCIIDNTEISCINVGLGESLNNNVHDREIFRSRYIAPGQNFGGYIAVDENEEIADRIVDIMNSGNMYFGGYISHGFGKCEGRAEKIDKMPYEKYRSSAAQSEMKLLLLSDTLMKNEYGEPCGLDMEYLCEKLGSFDISMCASSVRSVGLRNRTWNCRIPSENMYEKGSIFLLKFDKAPDMAVIEEIENKGLGIRRGEGFGQVVFTDAVPREAQKILIENKAKAEVYNTDVTEDENMLKALAAKYYKTQINIRMVDTLADKKKGPDKCFTKLSASQAGVIRAMVQRLKFTPERAVNEFDIFFKHNGEKQVSKSIKYEDAKEHINNVFDWHKFKNIISEKNNTYFGVDADALLSDRDKLMLQLDFIDKEIQMYLLDEGRRKNG